MNMIKHNLETDQKILLSMGVVEDSLKLLHTIKNTIKFLYDQEKDDMVGNFDIDDVYIAGGFIRRLLAGEKIDFTKTDIDIFIKPSSYHEFVNAMKKNYMGECKSIRKNEFAETVYLCEMFPNVQFINMHPNINSLESLLNTFDFTITQFGYSFATDEISYRLESYSHLMRKRLFPHKITYPIASFRRILKYAKQGYYMCDGAMKDFLTMTKGFDMEKETVRYID